MRGGVGRDGGQSQDDGQTESDEAHDTQLEWGRKLPKVKRKTQHNEHQRDGLDLDVPANPAVLLPVEEQRSEKPGLQ